MEDYEAMLEKTKAFEAEVKLDETEDAVACEAEPENEYDTVGDQPETASEEPTLIGWLWRMCIPIIPCAGIIIYLVLLCIWAFGGKETETMRTWAKAALIATVIQLVVFAAVFLVVELNTHIMDLLATVVKKI